MKLFKILGSVLARSFCCLRRKQYLTRKFCIMISLGKILFFVKIYFKPWENFIVSFSFLISDFSFLCIENKAFCFLFMKISVSYSENIFALFSCFKQDSSSLRLSYSCRSIDRLFACLSRVFIMVLNCLHRYCPIAAIWHVVIHICHIAVFIRIQYDLLS